MSKNVSTEAKYVSMILGFVAVSFMVFLQYIFYEYSSFFEISNYYLQFCFLFILPLIGYINLHKLVDKEQFPQFKTEFFLIKLSIYCWFILFFNGIISVIRFFWFNRYEQYKFDYYIFSWKFSLVFIYMYLIKIINFLSFVATIIIGYSSIVILFKPNEDNSDIEVLIQDNSQKSVINMQFICSSVMMICAFIVGTFRFFKIFNY